MNRLRIVLCLVLVGASACARASGAGNPFHGEVLLLSASGSLKAIDAGSGEVKYDLADAVASPGDSVIYAVDGTTLRTVDAGSGQTKSSTPIPPGLSSTVVAGDGHAVALVAASDVPPIGSMPAGKASTPIVVADPSGASKSRTYSLDGNFEPEAFSTNDKQLFMLSYSPALAPERYQVTKLDLARGSVSPAIGAVKGPAPKMRGTRVNHVLSPDLSILYTLYTNQDPSYSDQWGPGEAAFVHTLFLEYGQAVCIDLPEEFGPGPSAAKTLAISPDGSKLYAIDSDAGLVSVIGTRKREVTETKHMSFESGGQVTTAATGSGGTLYVGVGTQITVIDPESLSVTAHWNVPEPISGLTFADGHLFASSAGQVVEIDPSTGREISSVASPGGELISVVQGD
jgi:hypothetical protein